VHTAPGKRAVPNNIFYATVASESTMASKVDDVFWASNVNYDGAFPSSGHLALRGELQLCHQACLVQEAVRLPR
jgi:hypothetical protein